MLTNICAQDSNVGNPNGFISYDFLKCMPDLGKSLFLFQICVQLHRITEHYNIIKLELNLLHSVCTVDAEGELIKKS